MDCEEHLSKEPPFFHLHCISVYLDKFALLRNARGTDYPNVLRMAKAALILPEFAAAARIAQEVGLGVNAGHDLNLGNLRLFLETVPEILEVSIGHAIVVESFDCGLEATIKGYLNILASLNPVRKDL